MRSPDRTCHGLRLDLISSAGLREVLKRRREGVHSQLGVLHVALGDVEGGLRLIDEAVSLDPLGFYSLFTAGYSHARVGHPERAVPFLKRAIEVVPNYPFPRRTLAEAY